MFHGVHFNHDSQNSFSVHHDSRTPKVVDHGVTKIPLTIIIFMSTRGKIKLLIFLIMTAEEGRIVVFKEPVPKKVMTGHVIRKEGVPSEGRCRVKCYMEPNTFISI